MKVLKLGMTEKVVTHFWYCSLLEIPQGLTKPYLKSTELFLLTLWKVYDHQH